MNGLAEIIEIKHRPLIYINLQGKLKDIWKKQEKRIHPI
jgi:hypothetical protein